jgi:ribose 5-phosphate isomerase A
MSSIDALALQAVADIQPGMVVGLGTGRAATRAIEALAERAKRERLDIVCVATSQASDALGAARGLRMRPMESVERVDYLFDGADEVDPELRMLKGRGGAMTREKIVAHAAAHRVYLVQSTKLVDRLGASAWLPIEVLRFGFAAIRRQLFELGLEGHLREVDGSEYRTDNGNPVIDGAIPVGAHIPALAAALDALPGVVGHGLFLDEADVVLIEDQEGRVTRRER